MINWNLMDLMPEGWRITLLRHVNPSQAFENTPYLINQLELQIATSLGAEALLIHLERMK